MENKKNLIVKYEGSTEYAIKYLSVGNFLETNTIKQIPAYQRPYSWDITNVNRLFDDITDSIKFNKEWFIGPIFTSYKREKEEIRELLDGQQRITTLILILRNIYFAEYLTDENIWLNPQFSIPQNIENEETYIIKQKEINLSIFNNIRENIKELLLKKKSTSITESIQYISKFHTSLSTREALNKYIEDIYAIKNKEDWESRNSIEIKTGDNFEPTLISINTNIQVIQDRIRKIIIENKKPKIDGLINLIEFTKALLDLSFIEIPLNSGEDILDIFESLNNRGKKLSLTDIIRFRTIKEYSGNPNKQDEISRKWHEIFSISGKLISGNKDNKYFSNLDIFIERYINSIATENNGYTENDDRINRFTEYYTSNGRTLEDGVSDILITLKKWHYLLHGEFAQSPEWGRNSNNISSLIHLTKLSLLISQNSQVIFIAFLRNNFVDNFNNANQNLAVPHHLTEIIKTVFCISILNNTPSNSARSKYILIARSFDKKLLPKEHENSKKPYTYSNLNSSYQFNVDGEAVESTVFEDLPLISFDNPNISNILWIDRGEQKTAEFILGIYQLCMKKFIPEYSSYGWRNLDHVMPEKWFKNGGWVNLNTPIINRISDAIQNIQNATIKDCMLTLSKKDNFSSDSKWANSFTQLIGNKVMLGDSTNRDKSNSFWLEHPDNATKSKNGVREFLKNHFTQNINNSFILPEDPELLYNYEMFTVDTIMSRTEEIAKTIITELPNLVVKAK